MNIDLKRLVILPRFITSRLAIACAFALLLTRLGAAANPLPLNATGIITGIVTNRTTGNGLEGARIELPQLGLSTLVDATGRYVLTGVPGGTHEIVASYAGLDVARASLTVGAGQRATRDFEMTSNTYVLDPFVVAGEREGNAAAITQQRNADNVKDVVSMDVYGNLPNLSASELVTHLPGVTFISPGDEGPGGANVRGMGAGGATITIDGGLAASFQAASRDTVLTAFTGAMFESLEVVKGLTPDKGADSIGGTVNFKTRSPLSMREKRRFSYNLSVGHVPSFSEQVPIREQHRSHPLFNGTYLEKFRVFGSTEDNLAVSVNAFYSENAFGFFRTQRDYQQTDVQPAYLWDYRTTDNYNNRHLMSVNTRLDYRLSPNSILRVSQIYSDRPEPMRRQYMTRAFAGTQTTVPSATTGIVPGAFDSRITVVRANAPAASATSASTPTAAIDVTSTLINRFYRLRHMEIGGEHTWGRLELDWTAVWSRMRYRTGGAEGLLTNRIGGVPYIGPNGQRGSGTNTIVGPNGAAGVGWILDRTQSDLYPRFIQNGGLDFTNPNNYRPTENGLSSNSGDLNQHLVREVKGNARYKLPIQSISAYLKTGAQVREQTVSTWNINRHRWSYIGTPALPTDPSILLWDKVKTGRNVPVWEGAAFIQNGMPTNPALWQEDRYFNEQNKYTGFNRMQETASAAYIMTQGRFGNNGFLTGVRGEKTDDATEAFTRSRVASTAAQQLADPVGAAQRDYANNYRKIDGSYTKYFPSVHLWRNFTPNLKGLVSWSTSFRRPSMYNMLPIETVNEAQQTLTVGNPALRPQTAKNWDLRLDYYFEPAGHFSLGWFHKSIKDYMTSGQEAGTIGTGPDNGYNGQYPGFTLLTNSNAGMAIVQGWEFSYIQQFRFLPGILKTLSLNSNLTILNTHGDFGAVGSYRGNGQLAGFIPRTANVHLSWSYKRFGTRVLWSYTAENIRSFTAAQPSRNQYMMARELVILGLTYRVRPNLSLYLDVDNLFNEPQKYYRGIPDQLETFLMQGTKITAGIQGQF